MQIENIKVSSFYSIKRLKVSLVEDRMDYVDLKNVCFSKIKDNDPFKASRQIQVRNWCRSFYLLFEGTGHRHLQFFLDILFDDRNWEKEDTIYGMRLNRRAVAKEISAAQNRRGVKNPLEDLTRFKIANWCCLEEDIVALFEHFKKESKSDAKSPLKMMMSGNAKTCSTQLMDYWWHVLSGRTTELNLEGKHLHEYGLDHALSLEVGFVESIEYFWKKIKSVPNSALSCDDKCEVFVRAAVRAAGSYGTKHPDIFEFCFNHIMADSYPELLWLDIAENSYHSTLSALQIALRFDLFKELFNSSDPSNVSKCEFHIWLKRISRGCLEHYGKTCAALFMHVWGKKGFDSHRAWVVDREIVPSNPSFMATGILIPLVDKNYMEPVWAILDTADQSQSKIFMETDQAQYIRIVLKNFGDSSSLWRFLSYRRS